MNAQQTCPPRVCSKGFICKKYAQPCKTSADCKPESCCVVLDLDIIDSNIPGRLLPEASMQLCGDSSSLYCGSGVCGRTVPNWDNYV